MAMTVTIAIDDSLNVPEPRIFNHISLLFSLFTALYSLQWTTIHMHKCIVDVVFTFVCFCKISKWPWTWIVWNAAIVIKTMNSLFIYQMKKKNHRWSQLIVHWKCFVCHKCNANTWYCQWTGEMQTIQQRTFLILLWKW